MNKQPPSPRIRGDGNVLHVHSIFSTIQGEGPFSGRPAIFIRLAGCNLQCPACDTDYSSNSTPSTVEKVLRIVKGLVSTFTAYAPLVVITGGEPLRQNVFPLIHALRCNKITVQLETNGTYPIPESYQHLFSRNIVPMPTAYMVVSPKTATVHTSIERLAVAYKYVIHANHVSPHDGLPLIALGFTKSKRALARPPKHVPVYIHAEDTGDPEQNAKNLTAVAMLSIRYGYNAQVQLHKVLGVP